MELITALSKTRSHGTSHSLLHSMCFPRGNERFWLKETFAWLRSGNSQRVWNSCEFENLWQGAKKLIHEDTTGIKQTQGQTHIHKDKQRGRHTDTNTHTHTHTHIHTHIHTQTYTQERSLYSRHVECYLQRLKSFCYPTEWTLSALEKGSNLEKHVKWHGFHQCPWRKTYYHHYAKERVRLIQSQCLKPSLELKSILAK
jgi:hypothetical protein